MGSVHIQQHDERHLLEGIMVAVGVDGFLRLLWRYASQYLPAQRKQMRFADSLEEALMIIEAQRPETMRS